MSRPAHMSSKLSAALIAAVVLAIICWAIVQANRGSDSVVFDLVRAVPWGDKLCHAALFGSLTFFLNRTLGQRHLRWGWLQVGSLLVLAFALGEEFSQHFNGNRTLDLGDAAADVVGVTIATILSLRGKTAAESALPSSP